MGGDDIDQADPYGSVGDVVPQPAARAGWMGDGAQQAPVFSDDSAWADLGPEQLVVYNACQSVNTRQPPAT